MNFQIELTSHCNLACPECPHRFMKRKKELMSEEVFDKILYEYIVPHSQDNLAKGHNPTVILHKDGEPLIHPKIMQYMKKISDALPGIKIDIYTNGLLLTQKFIDFIKTLPNPIWILTSFHFLNENDSINDYSKVEDLLIDNLKIGMPPNISFICVSHVIKQYTEEKLKAWKKQFEERAPGMITVHVNNNLNPWTGLIDEPNCVTFSGCPYADFGHFFVGVTGNALACCMDLEEKMKFGNVMTDDINEIFDRLNFFYSGLQTKDLLPELCKKCMNVKE